LMLLTGKIPDPIIGTLIPVLPRVLYRFFLSCNGSHGMSILLFLPKERAGNTAADVPARAILKKSRLFNILLMVLTFTVLYFRESSANTFFIQHWILNRPISKPGTQAAGNHSLYIRSLYIHHKLKHWHHPQTHRNILKFRCVIFHSSISSAFSKISGFVSQTSGFVSLRLLSVDKSMTWITFPSSFSSTGI